MTHRKNNRNNTEQLTDDHIREMMGNMQESVARKAENAIETAQEIAGEKIEEAKNEIREKPFLYLAIALGVGAAVGYIAHERMQNGNRRE